MSEFVHLKLGEEIVAIGGSYILTKEVRLPFGGREVLYVVGYGSANSCCGAAGCAFAWVPGYVEKWKWDQRDGMAVSSVVPIRDPSTRQTVCDRIRLDEGVMQVNFM